MCFQDKISALLRNQNNTIDQVLILLDDEAKQIEPLKPREFPFARHPVYEELSTIEYYWVFLKQYLNFLEIIHIKYLKFGT